MFELFSPLVQKEEFYLYLNEVDNAALGIELTESLPSSHIFFAGSETMDSAFPQLFERKDPETKKVFYVNPDFVGLTPNDVHQIMNLLQLEDDVLILKKTQHKKVDFFATNNFRPEIAEIVKKKNFVCDSSLKKLSGLDYHVYKLKDIFSVTHANDFPELYKMLSRKENYDCCSKQIHDRFTHLFIEYKELL